MTPFKHFYCAYLVLILSIVGGKDVLAQEHTDAFSCLAQGTITLDAGQKFLTAVQEKYAAISALRGEFVQNSYLAALDTSERSSGHVRFRKPGMMRWDYLEPSKQSFVVKDSVIWLYQEQEQQLVIDQFREVLISDLPVAFLMGVGKLARDFKLLSACKSSGGMVFDLTPVKSTSTEEGQGLQEFKLMVDGSTHIPLGAKVIDVGQNVTSIQLRDLKTNPELAENQFHLDVPEGTDIIDRR